MGPTSLNSTPIFSHKLFVIAFSRIAVVPIAVMSLCMPIRLKVWISKMFLKPQQNTFSFCGISDVGQDFVFRYV